MRELLPILPHPSRLIGIEEGAVHKQLHNVELHCALAFPDTYEVGMSYLGQKILYGILNSHPTWWAERVMAPCRETGAILRQHQSPLCTLESDTPLAQTHCIGFSITHELAYTNVLYMLDLAHIPLRTAARCADGDSLTRWPLILAGGGALLSAEPLAPFMDIMVLGDGEETVVDIAHLLATARREQWTRSAFLAHARHIVGVYVPSLFAPTADSRLVPVLPDTPTPTRRIVANINTVPYPTTQVVPIGAVHNRLTLEIARGCTRGCRFCHAGMVYRPVRERTLPTLQTLLDECLTHTGFDEVSYLSLSTGDFSALRTFFHATMDRCAAEQISVSLPSLRVGSIDASIITRMAGIRRTGATLAPEAGSQRLRDVINKGITEEALLLHVQQLLQHGWQQIKLYFMIGLPTETPEDLDAIVELCRKVRDAGGRNTPRLQVTAAISPFVPKPFTPFQWEAQISLAQMQQRVDYLRKAFRTQKCLKMRWHEPAMSHLEGILSRGGRELADVVEKAYHKGGIFAAWADSFSLTPWQEALAECGLAAETYIAARPGDAPLPWDHLESGISKEFLLLEHQRALKAQYTQDCRYHACQQCGACDTTAAPSRLGRAAPGVAFGHILNLPQRDQESHAPIQNTADGMCSAPAANKLSTPPRIATELTQKSMEYRIWHTREGCAAFLSQLELQAILERALRRAQVPMAFSQGFHPLPLISFGRALPVGVASRAEWFAVTLRRPLSADAVCTRLNPHMPQGMQVLSAHLVGKSTRTVQAVGERFVLTHKGTITEQEHMLHLWRDFAAKDTLPWTRETKKGPRTVDIRALITRIVCVEATSDTPAHIRFTADWEMGYLSPLTLALAICGQDNIPHIHLLKTAQLFEDGTEFPAPSRTE